MGSLRGFTPNSKRLLPHIIDEIAVLRPESIWAEYPKSPSSYAEGFTAVTYRSFANAINGTAWWLQRTFGTSDGFPTLAYIGPNDVRYQLLLLGAIKAGFKMFFTSPRNSLEAHVSLFEATKCDTMLTTDPQPPPVAALLAAYKMNTVFVPSLDALLNENHPHFPYEKTYEESRKDPVYVLHTSGSTGIPKPLFYTHEWVSCCGDVSRLQAPEGFESFNASHHNARNFLLLPPFHIAGLYFAVINAIFNNTTTILPLPAGIPTADGLVDALNHVKADSIFLAPATIEDLSKSPALLEQVASKVDLLFWSGGSLPKSAGDVVAAKVPLFSCYGSSEYGAWPELREAAEWPKEDWDYFRLHPAIGAKFRHRGADLFELVLPRNGENERLLPPFLHFPDLYAYPTNDLFSPHPTKPDFWRCRGRNDDIIVFLNGEKTNPISFEGHVSSHSEVSAALMVGSQRMEAALILELAGDKYQLSAEQRVQLLERIWPKIEEANLSCPAHARIDKTHVLFADVPFLRAGKGTVQRKPTLQLYASRIDVLYADTEKTVPEAKVPQKNIEVGSIETNIQIIVSLIKDVGNFADITESTDIFFLGMDSVHVLQLTRKMKEAFACPVSPATVYLNPTPRELEVAIHKNVREAAESATKHEQDRLERLKATFETYRSQIDAVDRSGISTKRHQTSETETVLLTGSTGTIGALVLDELLEMPSVQHIYCLNRANDSRLLQAKRNSGKGISTKLPEDRVTFITADLANPQSFGIEVSRYQELLSKVTLVMHNAWPINWDSPLEFFRPQLSSIVNLVAFAASAGFNPRLFFHSSISAVFNSPISGAVEESMPDNFGVATNNGYGEAKLLCERLLDHAAHELRVPVTVVRLGQLAGGVQRSTGWKKEEWLPSMIISSRQLRALPESLEGASSGSSPTIDWIPVDMVPSILLELAFRSSEPEHHESTSSQYAEVFHVTNHQMTSWSALLPTIASTLAESLHVPNGTATSSNANGIAASSDKAPEIVILPLSTWLDRLRASGAFEVTTTASGAEVDENLFDVNPGLKMLGFYAEKEARKVPELRFDTTKAKEASPSLEKLEAVKPEWMAEWVRGWVADAKSAGNGEVDGENMF